MKRLFLLVALCLTAVGSLAQAATHSPCTSHLATAPRISLVNDSTVTLTGSGSIGGCPVPVGVESVTLTVCLQHDGADVSCASGSRAWSRYTRFARTYGLTVNAVCSPGLWRTVARGGDGFTPTEWASEQVSFSSADGYSCKEPGGA